MSIWEQAEAFRRQWEGGYVCDPADHGGETNWGITWPTLRRALAAGLVPSGTSVVSLTQAEASAIFAAYYWREPGFDMLPPALAVCCYDGGVNSGPHQATLWLQRALNQHGAHLAPDGLVGPATLAAAERLPQYPVLEDALQLRREFLEALVAARPSQARFRLGWARRVDALRRLCIGLLEPRAA